MYDAIVIGAGVMGSATAYNLAKAGANTLVLEQFSPRTYLRQFPRRQPYHPPDLREAVLYRIDEVRLCRMARSGKGIGEGSAVHNWQRDNWTGRTRLSPQHACEP